MCVHPPCITGTMNQAREGKKTKGTVGGNGLVERNFRKALDRRGQLRKALAYSGGPRSPKEPRTGSAG